MNIQNLIFSFFASLCVLMFWGCSKKHDNTLESNQSIVANWKWVRTDGGIANHIHETPISTGKNIDLIFKGDNSYSIYTNGVLTSQGTYSIEYHICIHDHLKKRVINFSTPSDEDMMIEKIDNYTLELSDDNYDGIGSSYSKK